MSDCLNFNLEKFQNFNLINHWLNTNLRLAQLDKTTYVPVKIYNILDFELKYYTSNQTIKIYGLIQ